VDDDGDYDVDEINRAYFKIYDDNLAKFGKDDWDFKEFDILSLFVLAEANDPDETVTNADAKIEWYRQLREMETDSDDPYPVIDKLHDICIVGLFLLNELTCETYTLEHMCHWYDTYTEEKSVSDIATHIANVIIQNVDKITLDDPMTQLNNLVDYRLSAIVASVQDYTNMYGISPNYYYKKQRQTLEDNLMDRIMNRRSMDVNVTDLEYLKEAYTLLVSSAMIVEYQQELELLITPVVKWLEHVTEKNEIVPKAAVLTMVLVKLNTRLKYAFNTLEFKYAWNHGIIESPDSESVSLASVRDGMVKFDHDLKRCLLIMAGVDESTRFSDILDKANGSKYYSASARSLVEELHQIKINNNQYSELLFETP
jgi:hypothetical protein